MVRVPAGEFEMGSSKGAGWEKPAHRVAVGSFEIGAHPVSNREFKVFRPSHHSVGNDAGDAAATGVSWQEAYDYAEWLSGRTKQRWQLPTEALWERAARGGLEQKDYPWGDDPPLPSGESGPGTPKPSPRPNAFGVHAGTDNLWEWVADWYAPDYYAASPTKNPTGPEQGVYKALRGGGYRNDPNSVRTYNRGSARPETRSDRITFRLVRVSGPGAPPPPDRLSQSSPPRPAPAPRPAATTAKAAPKPPATPVKAPAKASARPAATRAKAAPKPSPRPAAPAAGVVDVRSLDVRATGSGAEIELATSGRAGVKAFALDGPPRYVVDIQGARSRLGRDFGSKDVGQGGVAKVRWAQNQADPPVLRIVVDLDAAMSGSVEARADSILIRLAP